MKVLCANSPDGGLFFAAADPAARYVDPGVGTSRFAAVLHPFKAEEAARMALLRAGGTDIREHRR